MTHLRYVLRSILRSPGFAIAVVLTLGIGLGLNTAFFTILNATLLRPPAVSDSEHLVRIVRTDDAAALVPSTIEDFEALQKQTDVLANAVAQWSDEAYVDDNICRVLLVSTNYFSVLGGKTVLGRPLGPLDGGPVAVVSYRAWEEVLGRDGSVVGKRIDIRGRAFTIIGVAEPAFSGLEQAPHDFWIPFSGWKQDADPVQYVEIVGRLRDGITADQARTVLGAHVRSAEGAHSRASGVELRSVVNSEESARGRNVILPLLVSLILTLTAPCVNVANLLCARALARQPEISTRLALGAARRDVVLLFLTEGVLLATAAGVLGLALAHVALQQGLKWYLETVPAAVAPMLRTVVPTMALDMRVFSFSLIVAFLAGLASSLGPALQATRQDVAAGWRGQLGSHRIPALRRTLLVGQVAFCTFTVIAAVGLFRIGLAASAVNLGYDPEGLYSYTPVSDDRVAEDLLRQQPWVGSVARASQTHASDARPLPAGATRPVRCSTVSEEYFAAFRIPLLEGRSFTREEADQSAPMALVSKATAAEFWPNEDPVGKVVAIDRQGLVADGDDGPVAATVIGVAGDVVSGKISDGIDGTHIYLPGRLGADAQETFVRGIGNPREVARKLRAILSPIAMPGTEVLTFAVGDRPRLEAHWRWVLCSLCFLLAAIAITVTGSGLGSVLLQWVGMRSKELAIRVALGARPRDLALLVSVQALRMAAIGVPFGAVLYLILDATVLPGASPLGPAGHAVPYLAGTLIVVVVVSLAATVPAWRAARTRPSIGLRSE